MAVDIPWNQAAILGAVQGLTEFLPVSSSGHLVIGQAALGLHEPALVFDILLHIGTLAAVLIFYGRDIWRILRAWFLSLAGKAEGADRVAARVAWLLILGTLPAGVIGGLFNKKIEALFGNPRAAGVALLLTGLMLWIAGRTAPGRRGEGEMTWRDALLIGIAQAIAIVPGISRSGSTICTALLLGVEREQAARFSFLLSVPAILGAFVLKLKDLPEAANGAWGPMILGTAVSAGVGLLALGWLIRLVRRGNLRGFSYYCWAIGLISLFLL